MGVIDGRQVRFRKRPMNAFPPLCLARCIFQSKPTTHSDPNPAGDSIRNPPPIPVQTLPSVPIQSRPPIP